MGEPDVVTCELCGTEYPENDDRVRYSRIFGEWQCVDEEACDDRILEAADDAF
jgi:hypothetical protein